jgi:integrase
VIDSMPRPRPPHLHRQVTRHGKVAWYVRFGHGPKTRVRGEYGTPEFDAAYREALTGDRPKPTINAVHGTLGWLWLLYRQSSVWGGLKPPTRKQRENIMSHVLKTAGAEPLSSINRKGIIAGIDRRSATPFQAKNFLSTMRGLFVWAVASDLVRADPTLGVKVKKPKTNGFPVWNEEDIEQYERRWPIGTRERVMLDVFAYTGLRRGDAARVGRQHVRGGTISIQTEKTGMWVHLPILPILQRTLDAGPLGDLAFLARHDGMPFSKEGLGNAFRDACRAAGVMGKSAHGLRKAAATRLADNGATESQLEAIFGWSGGQMAALYTRAANRRKGARSAMSKLDEDRTSIPPPDEKVGAADRKE